MAVLYKTGNNPLWAFLDPSGKPAVGYIWATWRNAARDQPKAAYQDPGGLFPYPLRIALNSAGQVSINPIFFADDEPYYITVTAPGSTEPLYAFEGFTPTGGGPGGPEELPFKNLLVNGQFTFVNNPTPDIIVTTPFLTNIGPGWLFTKGSNDTATDTITFPRFSLGQTNVEEGNPVQYFQYNCTGPGTGETVKKLYQTLSRVNSLENQMIGLQLQGMSTVSTVITVTLTQFFGTGGAPSAPITTTFTGSPFALTSTWEKFLASMTVPSTGGKTLGTNGDDYVAIEINIPLNQAANVNLTNIMVILGELQPTYDYFSYQTELARDYTAQNPAPIQESIILMSQGISDMNKPLLYTGLNTFAYADIFPPGSYLPIAWNAVTIPESSPLFPRGYLIADGRGLSGYSPDFRFRRLYNYIGNLYGYGGDGLQLVAGGGTATIQIRNFTAGTVTAWMDISTGIVFSAIATSPNRITQLVVPAAGLITAGSYFYAFGVSAQYVPYFIKDGIGDDPLIVGKVSIPIPISGTNTAIQVATAISTQLAAAGFSLPTPNIGLFMRSTLPGVAPTYDPDWAARTAPFAGGIGGNSPGSYQPNQVQALTNTHNHGISYPDAAPEGYSGSNVGAGAQTATTGRLQFSLPGATNQATINLSAGSGNQTNPHNYQWTLLIKY